MHGISNGNYFIAFCAEAQMHESIWWWLLWYFTNRHWRVCFANCNNWAPFYLLKCQQKWCFAIESSPYIDWKDEWIVVLCRLWYGRCLLHSQSMSAQKAHASQTATNSNTQLKDMSRFRSQVGFSCYVVCSSAFGCKGNRAENDHMCSTIVFGGHGLGHEYTIVSTFNTRSQQAERAWLVVLIWKL